jgi:hypothetical protein
MKHVLRLLIIASVMTLGLAAQAQAITTLQLIACQGALCVASPVTVGNLVTSAPNVTVGDFAVNAQGGAFESALVSNAQETSLNVRRLTSINAAPLDVYLVATNYNMPIPVATMSSTHGASFTDVGAANAAASVSFIGWFANGNVTLTPAPPAGGGNFAGPITAPPGAGFQTNGLIACVPSGGGLTESCAVNGAASAVAGASVPFSLITRTTFNIGTAAQNIGDIYTSNSQLAVFPASQPVPDQPSSMFLLAMAAIGVGAARCWFAS